MDFDNIKIIKKIGNDDDRQGRTELVEIPFKDSNETVLAVSKLPKRVGFLADHETQILMDLITLNLPHFCSYYGTHNNKVYMEYVHEDGLIASLDKYISKYEFKITINLIKQVIMALSISQKYINFTHYDLHSDNILIKKVNPNSVYLYVLDEDNQFYVPTNGLCAVIIDYGYSYTKNSNGVYGSLEFTELGYTPNMFDPCIDCMRFLITVSNLIKNTNRKFRNIVRNIYPLDEHVSMTSGWFKKNNYSILMNIQHKIKSEIYNESSILYSKCIQSLLILQGIIKKDTDHDYKNINIDYYRFSQEFDKLVVNMRPVEKLALLKKLVSLFVDGKSLDTVIDDKTSCNCDFINLKEYMTTLQNSISGYVYYITNQLNQYKSEIYSKIKLNTEQIFGALDFNFCDDFKFNRYTKIYVWKDCKLTEHVIPPSKIKQVSKLNKVIHPLRGTFLYDLLFK